MKSRLLAFVVLLSATDGGAHGTVSSNALGQPSQFFIENQGQIDRRVDYYLLGRDRAVFVNGDGLTLLLQPAPTAQSKEVPFLVTHQHRAPAERSRSGEAFAVRLEFVGGRRDARPRAEGNNGPLVNLFIGGRRNWRTSVPTTSELVYTDLWPGIDLALIGGMQEICYEFRIRPGADPDQIRLRYRGAGAPRLEATGDLALATPLGSLRDGRPFSFQETGGQRIEIGSRYAVEEEDGTFGFAVDDYDRAKPLVIDPALFVYGSYLGGAGEDMGTAIAVGPSGAAYVTGITSSVETSFPTGDGIGSIPGADGTQDGGDWDAFVAKILPSGEGFEYVTYVGGSGTDVSSGIAVDSSGAAYMTGYTDSGAQFPIQGDLGTSYNGGAHDVWVLKLSPSGTALLYSGFIGGADDDREPAIAIDGSRSAYLTGLTYSGESTFPTGAGFGFLPGADQSHNGDADAFAVKVSRDGSSLEYATYIGGSNFDNGYSIGVDPRGNAYVGGNVASQEDTFPDGDGVGGIPGPDTSYNGGAFDGFVVKLNPTGTAFSYVAFVGGAEEDRYVSGLAVSNQGSAWLAGRTSSAEDTFPNGLGFGSIPGFDQTSNGGLDAFVVKINASGTAFEYATFLGGSGDDEVVKITADSQGSAFVTGWTSSTESSFPDGDGFGGIPGPDTTYNGGSNDAFVVKLNAAGTGLSYATYIGGPGTGALELGADIAVDGAGSAYVTGYTSSDSGFPGGSGFGDLPGVDQTHNGGVLDAFVVKISADHPH